MRAARTLAVLAVFLVATAQAPVPAPEPATAPAEADRPSNFGPPPLRIPPNFRPREQVPDELARGKAEFEKNNFGPAYLALLPLGQRGNAEAQYLLGRISDEGGGGINIDPREALRWYRLAASKDHPKALYAIAKAYATARGVNPDPQQALNFLARSADADFTPAILDLASLFDDGRGVDLDRAQAFAWYKRAADLGNTEARFMVAERLQNGDGVEQDRDEARRWYTAASLRGHPGALFRLAQLGFGTNRTSVEYRVNAYTWLTLAQQRGGPDIRTEATNMRNELAKTMIQVDIDAAMAKVRAWRPAPPPRGERVDPEDPYNDPDKLRFGR